MIINTHNLKPIEGKYVNLREVETSDAEFILSLRCDEKKSRFLHKTEYNVDKQIAYINHYKTLADQWYFIIENKDHQAVGTIRIYDVEGSVFTGGSWLMKDGVSSGESIEGIILLKDFAFKTLGFEKEHFDVRKKNTKVLKFHNLCGATIVDENDLDYFLDLSKEVYLEKRNFFIKAFELELTERK